MKATTPRHGLHSAFLRVARAEEHLVNLNAALSSFTLAERYRFKPEYDSNPPHGIVGWRYPKTLVVPSLGAILIGEICYNLRCALDYLIVALSLLDNRKRPSFAQFPFETDPKMFPCREKTWLKHINCTHRAMIERLQPYNRVHWTTILRNISNMDKHNELIRIRAQIRIDTAPLREGESWGAYVRRAPTTLWGKEMDVYYQISINIPVR